ncbi:hypothetical protein [Streptosporangium sandarakinum]|uniref:hypothetical protein n=1 Tax=Streptosporangium sandarakinum TaxID=1260955 RepID=UPI0034288279
MPNAILAGAPSERAAGRCIISCTLATTEKKAVSTSTESPVYPLRKKSWCRGDRPGPVRAVSAAAATTASQKSFMGPAKGTRTNVDPARRLCQARSLHL